MHDEIDEGVRLMSTPYWMLILLSVGIATLGLITNSPAVIIGAMLVSPLMAPIIALGISVAVTDLYLGVKSLLVLMISIIASILIAAFLTLIVPISEPTSEILSRTNPTFLDLGIAIFSGGVAALSSVRSKGEEILGKVGAGAAIGVALMPPLCVVGFGMGKDFNTEIMWGSFLLFMTNMAAIVLVSALFYYFAFASFGITKLFSRFSRERSKEDVLYKFLIRQRLWKQTTDNLTSWKRFMFPVVLVGMVIWPLWSSLLFLKKTYDIKAFIDRRLQKIDSFNSIRGTEQLTYGREGVAGAIVFSSKTSLPESFTEGLQQEISEHFEGYRAAIRLVRVAGESDLLALKEASKKSPEVTLENSPSTLHDALRNQHAMELARRAQELIAVRFPGSAGIMKRTSLTYTADGLQMVTVEYLGNKLKDDVRIALEDTFLNVLRELKGDAGRVTLVHAGAISGGRGCGRTVREEDVLRALEELSEPLRYNHNLRLQVSVSEHVRKFVSDSVYVTNERFTLMNASPLKCHIEYKYSTF